MGAAARILASFWRSTGLATAGCVTWRGLFSGPAGNPVGSIEHFRLEIWEAAFTKMLAFSRVPLTAHYGDFCNQTASRSLTEIHLPSYIESIGEAANSRDGFAPTLMLRGRFERFEPTRSNPRERVGR